MTWKGTKNYMEAETNDGYLLTVKPMKPSKYTWNVYYKGKRIQHLENNPIYKENIPRAKRQAIRLMVSHMLKRIT
ncbi:hypothetical protein [uncultured Kordia sp.]|uniref:hypothetical protein n=1 Tax=uncultured Kordia sp. TaxID=507699 RepID=UPI00262DA967|nr:hypothetical protein [uncultured Kordia sp.]